jgi:hypothetical protein
MNDQATLELLGYQRRHQEDVWQMSGEERVAKFYFQSLRALHSQ